MFFPTWEASSITDVTWGNRLCSTTFVRWLNVMSCLCYFSLSQLLGSRLASSTQWDTTTLLLVTSPSTSHPNRWWSRMEVVGGGCRALLFPCLKGLLSNVQDCTLNLRTFRNPKHVKDLATGIQWLIVLSKLLHMWLVRGPDGNFWLWFSSEMWHRMWWN